MKTIAVSQRVDWYPDRGESRDGLDHAWAELFEGLNFLLVPVPNQPTAIDLWLQRVNPDGVLLSGGNDLGGMYGAENVSDLRDRVEASLLDWAEANNRPVVGVCRGFQFINRYLGGTLEPQTGHVRTSHGVEPSADSLSIFKGYRTVNSFHRWSISAESLGSDLVPQIYADDLSIEAALHSSLPWVGMMWHPEREGVSGKLDIQLLKWAFRRD